MIIKMDTRILLFIPMELLELIGDNQKSKKGIGCRDIKPRFPFGKRKC